MFSKCNSKNHSISPAMSVRRDFSGKVVLITGSSSGIGAYTGIEFARTGAQVVITGRNAKNLAEVGKQCLEASPKKLKALEVVADVCEPEDCRKIIDSTIKAFGKLDILINNAGAGGPASLDNEKILEVFDRMINLNLRSVVYLTHLAIKHLEKTKGNVINISSVAGLKPFPSMGTYCIAKSGLDMFTRVAALELGPRGIRVNVINPAGVRTNFGSVLGMNTEDFAKLVDDHGKSYPMGRGGEPSDIASAIMFLASDESSWFTGINFVADGGALNSPAVNSVKFD